MNQYDMLVLPVLITIVVGYLLGSVNFSIIITKIVKNKDDIRKYGSGNAGATNVLRSVGKGPAAATFVLDFAKCAASVIIGYYIVYYASAGENVSVHAAVIGKYSAGIACIIGHIFPVYFSFKGGKGVTTTAAMIALTDWRVFILIMIVFISVLLARHIVSLASICSGIALPFLTFAANYFLNYVDSPIPVDGTDSFAYVVSVTIASLFIGFLLIIVHRENIVRLKRGEEKPISLKKKDS